MKKRMTPTARLNAILESRYGVTITTACPLTVLWAVDRLPETVDAVAAVKGANRQRAKQGRGVGAQPVYAPYGSRAF